MNEFRDLLDDTFREIVAGGIASTHKKALLKAVKSFAVRFQLTVFTRIDLRRLKPKQVVSKLLNSLENGGSIEGFLEQNVLPKLSRAPKECSWEKVVRYLTAKRPDKKELNRELSERVPNLEDETGLGGPSGRKRESPPMALFRVLDKYLWQDLRAETNEALDLFQDKSEQVQIAVRYRIGKPVWFSLYGGFVDICVAGDTRLFYDRNFTLIGMLEADSYLGFCLVHVAKEDREKILLLAGCEPKREYLSERSAEEVYEGVVKALALFARRAGIKKVGQTSNSMAISNESSILKYVEGTVFPRCSKERLSKEIYLGSYAGGALHIRRILCALRGISERKGA